jgi:hypothetical protein
MRNIRMKYYFLLLFLGIYTKNFCQGYQPTYSVTITPTSNTTDVKGNIKASGLVEANSLKATSLATGNPFVVNPVYANADGDLITGYKVGYYSIPPAAFKINYDINTDGTVFLLGADFIVYSPSGMFFLHPSTNRIALAPIQVPHKSKLSSIKVSFGSYYSRYINIKIVKVNINDFSSETTLFNHDTAASIDNSLVSENIPLNLLEIDNQNFTYSIVIALSNSDWSLFSLRGVSIEYQDL